tara:strand:+ start:1508 stop:2308 length:801 start_codon:yes stop_codon:yes gene_type:complete
MKTVLIFGSGWLAHRLIRPLVSSNRRIIIATRDLKGKKNELYLEFFQIGYDENGSVQFDIEIPYVIDEIMVMLPPSGMGDYANTIASICKQFPTVLHFLFTSSTGVYLDNEGWVNEHSALKIDHPIVMAENLIKAAYPKNHTILRLSGLIGRDRHPVIYFLRKSLNPNGNAPVNLIHRMDIVRAIILVIAQAQKFGVYNLCYPNNPLKRKYYNEISEKIFQKRIEFEKNGKGKKIDGSKFASDFQFEYENDIYDISLLDKVIVNNN